MPDEIDGYWVSEDRLAMLEAGKRDALAGFAWAMIAMATGAAPGALTALAKAYWLAKPTPMGGVDQIQFTLMMSGFVLGGLAFIIVAARGRKSRDVGNDIRAQKK
jgi:hypothetical protein